MSVRYKQNPAIEAASLQDETILLDLDTNEFCILNHTASVIWSKVRSKGFRGRTRPVLWTYQARGWAFLYVSSKYLASTWVYFWVVDRLA